MRERERAGRGSRRGGGRGELEGERGRGMPRCRGVITIMMIIIITI
jgi:hypothetical protein